MQTLRNESNDTEKHEKVIKTQYSWLRLTGSRVTGSFGYLDHFFKSQIT